MQQLRQIACVGSFRYCDAIRHPGIGRKLSVKASRCVDAAIFMGDLNHEIGQTVGDYAIIIHLVYGALITY